MYVYIYIYMNNRERDRLREGERERDTVAARRPFCGRPICTANLRFYI